MEETFTYDDMNRLTGITLKRSSGQDLTCAVTYDALGRMTSRQAVTAVNLVPQVTQVFSQSVFDATKVHALASATTSSGVFPPTPQNITYTGFDKVSKVKQGTDSICYTYGFNQQRIYMEEHAGATDCTKQYWGSCEYVTESDGIAISTYWRTFVTGPYGVFAVVESRNGVDQFHYVLKDNLGSWTTITNSTGTVEQQLSYDAWGNLRNPNSWANYRAGDTYDGPMFDRGYTGHEHHYHFGLINMNGRMYDPVMGGFLSVDRFVQNPLTAQGFNRYSYCMNNPLRFVDPTGWEPRPGGGNGDGPYLPGAPYYVDGMLTVDLPEIIIMPDNPSLSNRKEAVTYNTYYYGGERLNLSWTSNSEGQSVGPNSGGCGGGSGNHGGGNNIPFSNQKDGVYNLLNNDNSLNIYLIKINNAFFYINSSNTIIGKGAEYASVVSTVFKEVETATILGKVATGSKYLGIIGVGINIGCTSWQIYNNYISWQEGVVRMGMTGVEFGLTFIPYIGPILSIGLTAFDIGGGFDDNLYNTEKWWKGTQP